MSSRIMGTKNSAEAGVTLVELMVTMVVFVMIALGFLALYSALVRSSLIAKRQAVGLTMATNQMEYLKSLPYDDLAVQGGSIIATSYIPGVSTKVVNGLTYTTTVTISYVDDAFDGCANYPTVAIKTKYCRGYSSSTTSTVDSNPADYKIADVTVTDPSGTRLADVDTEFSARVAETASTTGALFVTVVDASGTPVNGAQVKVANTTVTPNVNATDNTDSNGLAIFYGLPVDTGTDYTLTASASGYSSLSTIAANGSLQPTYPNLTILSQQASSETLVIKPMGVPSLLLQATDVNGAALAGVKVYIKGGYKSYTATADTSYYFDNLTSGDTRPTTDSNGLIGVNSLVPGPYYFCGDSGAINCKVGSTTYYLAAAVPYSGSTALNPLNVPTYSSASPPTTTYAYGAANYLQKVQLLLTTSSTFPRVSTLSPSVANLSGGNISSFGFNITGVNLPCSATAASCSTTVKLQQGSATYTASCTGTSAGINLSCSVNLSAASVGGTRLIITTANGTLTLPTSPQLGGISLEP